MAYQVCMPAMTDSKDDDEHDLLGGPAGIVRGATSVIRLVLTNTECDIVRSAAITAAAMATLAVQGDVSLSDLQNLVALSYEYAKKAHEDSKSDTNVTKIPRLDQFYDGATERINAQSIVDYLGINLSDLAPAQAALEPIVKSIEMLSDMLGNDSQVRQWFNKLHPQLGNVTPLEIILKGKADMLWNMLQSATLGIF